jgi:predicted porin
MKKTVIAAAVLAASAGAVQAQSVTIYGIVDVGFEFQNNANASGDSLSSLQNGGILPSIWGFKGSEDLGGGLKAVFNLEGDFGGDTGGLRFGGALNLFGRQANVGLSGDFGTVLLGRQYAPALLAELGTDPRGYKESFSSLLPYALANAPEGNDISGNNFLGIFTGNMVSYTNSFGPVTLRAGYGLGEVAGENSDATTVSLGATYTGPVTVSATYQKIKGGAVTSESESERVGLGFAVPFGDFTAKALYAMTKFDDATGSEVLDGKLLGIGVDWKWNPQNTLTVAGYYGDEDAADGKSFDLVISNDYAISKRTVIYAQLVHSDLDDGTASPLLSIAADRWLLGSAGVADLTKTMTIVSVGIKHSF